MAVLSALAAGCLAPTPADPAAAAPVAQGMVVTATRVEPLVHAVDEHGAIESRPCTEGEGDCDMAVLVAGLGWEAPVRDFGDPAALFWRVSLRADWTSHDSLVTGLTMTVFATKPCGLACVRERQVGTVTGSSGPGFEALDVFLQPGETGVRVRLDPVGHTESAVSEARVAYWLHGRVAGYRAAAEPVVLS